MCLYVCACTCGCVSCVCHLNSSIGSLYYIYNLPWINFAMDFRPLVIRLNSKQRDPTESTRGCNVTSHNSPKVREDSHSFVKTSVTAFGSQLRWKSTYTQVCLSRYMHVCTSACVACARVPVCTCVRVRVCAFVWWCGCDVCAYFMLMWVMCVRVFVSECDCITKHRY